MAEDSDLEKTEPASPRRLEKAREEGQVARSRELNTFLLLAAGVAALWVGGAGMYQSLTDILRAGLWFDTRVGQDTKVMLDVAAGSASQALYMLLPMFGLLAATAVLASVLLGGLLLSTKALAPKFERLNPLKGVARMFSAQTLVELLKTLVKAAVVGGVAVMVISHYVDQMISLMHASPTAALAAGIGLVALCCALIVGGLILIVLIDAPWQLFSHFKKLRMSRQDVKQENKESDGDPHVKGRIRQQQRAMARRRMMAEVPKADVIVTNPTHYSVALSYKEGRQAAPTVVAKGSGLTAARIRGVGEEHKVPILSAPPLARALYHNVELGQEIPAALYAAVAEVLAWVFQLRNWNPGMGVEPRRPERLVIPPGLDPESKEKVAANAS
ncbi:flagellar biosynthesis protein FlhB [Parapusillimonas granuli]|uniref:Flagellar biosynthetic protein FlhB n=1 Tax=Parapusillimonas granuli TaxID=380911 RepID=A0A853FQZ3_9BURK|nr:flagellar biosynthesis protein FlhB [Parapusillimonas granuli]MBB5213405.1 flagellar biosynthetic protein FlhB [Parapusillimonas granuli]MEB2398505.1 flagellar biosynthesis protein FlhB [Alcaligenaceae bacterium]NYT48244.1 flagellar type III secretion system protein FlhB [Parapusillimonas granuli]